MHAPFSRWSEVVSRMQGHLTLNMLSGNIKGYDLEKLRTAISGGDEARVENSEDASTDFDRWDIETTITDENLVIDKSVIQMGNWQLLTKGTADIQTEDNKSNGYEIKLDAVLKKVPRSDKACSDVACVMNSLAKPLSFLMSGSRFPFGIIDLQRNNASEGQLD